MNAKTISLSRAAYDALKREKGANESFSKLVCRLVAKSGDIKSYAGAWADMSDEEADEMKASIDAMRKNATDRLLR